MIIKRQRSSLAVLVLSLFFTIATSGLSHAEEVVLRKNNFSFSVGAFQLGSATKTVSSFGLIQMQYRRAINAHWNVEGAYVNGLSVTSLGSFFSGFDIGVARAFWLGAPSVEKVGDIMVIDEHRKFGILGGVGFSERSVPLTGGTLSYSGPYFAVQPQYYLTDSLEAHARIQYVYLVNGAASLTQTSIVFGLGILF